MTVRKEFAASIEKAAASDESVIFLTGDLGFMALENLQKAMKARFINAGVSEQNMISLAAGLASQGLAPICYSIAPFLVFRPAEQIRLDVCLHNMNVKLVGNGGGYGYGIMGATHHAIEDLAMLSSFRSMKCYVPFCGGDVEGAVAAMMKRKGPSYLRLGYGDSPRGLEIPVFAPIRRLVSGSRATVVALGPIALNACEAAQKAAGGADVFVVSELPLAGLPADLLESINRTKKVIIAEEHVSRGGLGENLSLLLLKAGVGCRVVHKFAAGYPEGKYGSQAYHRKQSGLDAGSLNKLIREMSNG